MKSPFSIPTATVAFALLASPALRAQSSAVAVISPTAGSHVSGTVVFTAIAGGLHVVAEVNGLSPGPHGFHIHEYGDLRDAAKAMATGGHYDPAGTMHHALVPSAAGARQEHHHAGDMGNLTADETGHAHLEMDLTDLSLTGAPQPIVGRAVIIHGKPDDGGQPTGNAGGRVGQGVIGIAKN